MLAFLDSETGEITQYPVKVNDVKRRFPNTSFLLPLEGRDLEADFGVVTVFESTPPTYDSNTRKLVQLTPALVDGRWTQQWSVVPYTEEEQAKVDEELAVNVRQIRNKKLADSDWTQLPDSTVSNTDWATYRQNLRDVPAQSSFPRNVTWPTEPS